MSLIESLAYVHAAGDGGSRGGWTQMVVVHCTDNLASAESEASYASRRTDSVSAHIYVDSDSAVRALPLDNIAYGCYPLGNERSVQFELTGLSNLISDATMRQAAPLVAEVCQRYGLPIRKVSASELVAGAKGICGHGDVTNAWHQGDHTDPGSAFPWPTFIAYVQAAANGDLEDMNSDQNAALQRIDNALNMLNSPLGYANGGALQQLAALARGAGAPTQEQVDAAMLKAMRDPSTIDAIAAKLAALVPTAVQVAKAVADEEAARLANG